MRKRENDHYELAIFFPVAVPTFKGKRCIYGGIQPCHLESAFGDRFRAFGAEAPQKMDGQLQGLRSVGFRSEIGCIAAAKKGHCHVDSQRFDR